VVDVREVSGGRIGGVLAVVAGLGFLVCLPTLHGQGKSAKDVYLDKCSVCHGADGAGQTAKGKKLKVKDVRAQAVALTVAQMVDVVTKGKDPNMDGYAKELSADQIQQVVSYYRSLAQPAKPAKP
jgi:cytochrome c6